MDEPERWDSPEEYWAWVVEQANSPGGHEHSRMLFEGLIRYLRTDSLTNPPVREFLADRLEQALSVKNPGEAGKALKINRPPNTRGSRLNPMKAEFFAWYHKQREPSGKDVRDWRARSEASGGKVSDRTFSDWRKEASKVHELFKSIKTDT